MTIPRIKLLAVAIGAATCSPFVHAADQDTVVVTATGFEQKIQNAPASISVISKQQIEDNYRCPERRPGRCRHWRREQQ